MSEIAEQSQTIDQSTMKKTFYLLCFISLSLISQQLKAQDYMDDITRATCECADSLDQSLGKEEYQMALGLCIFAAAEPYYDKLEEDYDFTMAEIDTKGEELGRIVGTRMAAICPETIAVLAKKMYGEDEIDQNFFFTGTVTKIETGSFTVLSIQNGQGKTTKCYWLTYVETDFDISEGLEELEGEQVVVETQDMELYDPRLGEYRDFKVISSLEVAE